jgi:hypothetical protein
MKKRKSNGVVGAAKRVESPRASIFVFANEEDAYKEACTWLKKLHEIDAGCQTAVQQIGHSFVLRVLDCAIPRIEFEKRLGAMLPAKGRKPNVGVDEPQVVEWQGKKWRLSDIVGWVEFGRKLGLALSDASGYLEEVGGVLHELCKQFGVEDISPDGTWLGLDAMLAALKNQETICFLVFPWKWPAWENQVKVVGRQSGQKSREAKDQKEEGDSSPGAEEQVAQADPGGDQGSERKQ